MKFKISLCALLLGASLAVHADSRVHTVQSAQTIQFSDDSQDTPGRVAIDGNFAIVISYYGGGRLAYLYQRGADGEWTARATFARGQTTTPAQDDDVAMANGIAALRIGPLLHIYERSGDTYVEADTAGTPAAAPGLAISGRSILAARLGCNYDADVYEKSLGSGVWRINGRISGAVGACNNHGAALDLDGNVALVRNSPTEIREYRRNGTALQWVQVGTITPPAGASFTLGAPTLSGNIAFVSEGRYFERVGSSWTFRGRVEPLDSAFGTVPYAADYRGPLLLSESVDSFFRATPQPYLYMRNSAGGFDHVAVLGTADGGVLRRRQRQSGRGLERRPLRRNFLSFFELPVPLVAPAAIANDFEAHDITGWQPQSGSQFALATTSAGTVYRQSSLVGKSTSLLTGSDWANAQSIEADIKPTAVDGSDRWVGLAVRYVDVNNQYYVTLRGSNKLFLQRMVAGSFTTLAEAALPFQLNRTYHVKLIANGPHLSVSIDNKTSMSAFDDSLVHGRARSHDVQGTCRLRQRLRRNHRAFRTRVQGLPEIPSTPLPISPFWVAPGQKSNRTPQTMTQMPRSRRPITARMHAPSSASRPATRSLKQRPTSIPLPVRRPAGSDCWRAGWTRTPITISPCAATDASISARRSTVLSRCSSRYPSLRRRARTIASSSPWLAMNCMPTSTTCSSPAPSTAR